MYALSIFNQQPLSKAEQSNFVNQAVEEILSGDVDPVVADLHLKALEEVIGKIRKNEQVKEYTLTEAQKYGKTFTKNGVKIEIGNRKTKDYTGCGDRVYSELMEQQEALKAQIKAREKMLDTGVNPETGETYNPPADTVTTFLKYTF